MKNIFKKKNKQEEKPFRKLEIKHEPRADELNTSGIKISPLVTIEKHESRVNGKPKAPEFRISIGGRDIIMLNSREYNELFSEMLYRMSNDEVIHAIFEKHAMEHAEIEAMSGGIGRMLEKVKLGEILENLTKQADDAHNG